MKIPKKLIAACQNYYFNWYRQYKIEYSNETKSGVKAEKSGYVWDKPADLAIIDKVCIDLNISFFEGIAGTFWFYLPTKKGKTKCVTTDMDAFPTFEPVKKKEANAS